VNADKHVIVQRSRGAFEVWAPCAEEGCGVHHKVVATCPSRWDAEKIAGKLNEVKR
jgi:hypothetical protein